MAEAKATLVSVDGIGAELLPALLAWDAHDEPIGYCIIQNPHVTMTQLYRNLTLAAGLMVTGWHAHALAITTESYVEPTSPFEPNNTTQPNTNNQHDTRSLAERYPTDPTVQEALWVAYTNNHHDHCMGVMTMQQHVGRRVTFGEPTYSDLDQHDEFDTPGTLQHILAAALALPRLALPEGHPLHTARRRIAAEIHKLGFTVYLDNDPNWSTQSH